ncbi:MAG: hypothetical protein ACPGJV_10785 [Bacteriovoracaceae bacterium]
MNQFEIIFIDDEKLLLDTYCTVCKEIALVALEQGLANVLAKPRSTEKLSEAIEKFGKKAVLEINGE